MTYFTNVWRNIMSRNNVSIKARVGVPRFEAKEITVDVPVSALKDQARIDHYVRNAFLKHIRKFLVVQNITLPPEEE
jgi:hypothetical protein